LKGANIPLNQLREMFVQIFATSSKKMSLANVSDAQGDQLDEFSPIGRRKCVGLHFGRFFLKTDLVALLTKHHNHSKLIMFGISCIGTFCGSFILLLPFEIYMVIICRLKRFRLQLKLIIMPTRVLNIHECLLYAALKIYKLFY
jgi:hypothetical protein